ncbi:MAG: hypothetical protein M1503_10935 [Thaumarchaeota archaeon]|nr:hypothetical protein [Nitrososphaerota archaeon]
MQNTFPLLAGARGLVYLMMVGRKVKASDLWFEFERLNKTGFKIIEMRPTVYGYVNRLEKSNLIEGRREKRRGNPTYREAIPDTIFDTLAQYELLTAKDKQSLEILLKHLDGLVEIFPLFLLARARNGIRSLNWYETLSIFLEFSVHAIQRCIEQPSSKADTAGLLVESPEEHLQQISHSLEEGKIGKEMHRTMTKSIAVEMTLSELSNHVASMSTQDRDIMRGLANDSKDVYRRDSFLFKIYILSIMLRDPERGSEIYNWAVQVDKSNTTDKITY